MLKKQNSTTYNYQHVAYGTWGRFNTPAGVIDFLETKAKIGTASTDAETRLTRFLKPVREALNTRDMDFNQLLQRDLDDHRVATELIPYLLQPSSQGPAFYPPIVTALLPFDGPKPLEDFPERTSIELYEDDEACWKGYAFGDAFKFEKASDKGGLDSKYKVGQLSWNDEKAQMVVIDGQHRAMALLAVHRTLNRLWEGQGDKYKHFYEAPVLELLNLIPTDKRDNLFQNIELPVTILWFPEISSGNGTSHQRAARKLFVDVNKNARKPSESRVLLLSDTDLSAIFTRRVLNTFRNNGSDTLPISAIEYDHPERDQAASAKWSAISNVSIIHGCVYRAVFGPAKYINDLQSNFRGKENEAEAKKFMHMTLQISDIIPAVVTDGERSIQRENISNRDFPRSNLDQIEAQFMKGWGPLIVRMLSELTPYKAHGDAVKELRDGWSGSDSTGRLARDAVFEGVGMYWTLRDSHEHWREKNKLLMQSSQPPLNKTDIVHAWEETEKKRSEFELIRAKYYLEATNSKAIEASRAAYAVFGTYACQLGFILAARSLAFLAGLKLEEVGGFIDKIVEGANAGLSGKAPGDYGRKVVMSPDAPGAPLNMIPKLDSPFAVYFRYFWLEILGTAEARPHVQLVVNEAVLDDAIKHSRAHYFDRLQEIFKNSVKNLNPEWLPPKIASEARERATKELSKALKKWFGMSQEAFDAWLESLEQTPPSSIPEHQDTAANSASETGPDDTDVESELPPSFEDLLKDG